MAGALMARPADSSERDALLNYFAPIERERLSGAHSEVFIVEQVGDPRGPSFLIDSHKPEELMYRGGTSGNVEGQPGKMFALKRQLIQQPDDEDERTYRELKIFMELRRLLMQGMSPNFVTIQGWIKCTPPLLFPSRYYHGDEDQFGLYVLEYAHYDLSHHKQLSLPRYRSMLFQVLWGLYLAQRELQFVHHDIHVRNILLQPLADNVPGTAYRLAARDVPPAFWGERAASLGGDSAATDDSAPGSMVWFSPFFVVKITDFGLSSTRSETSTCDIEKAILELKKVVINWNETSDLDTEAAAAAKACPCSCGKGASTRMLSSVGDIKEARKQLTNLRRESSRPGCSALRLLCHPFFDPLRINTMPCSCVGAWRFASDGFQPIKPQSSVAAALAKTLPSLPGRVTNEAVNGAAHGAANGAANGARNGAGGPAVGGLANGGVLVGGVAGRVATGGMVERRIQASGVGKVNGVTHGATVVFAGSEDVVMEEAPQLASEEEDIEIVDIMNYSDKEDIEPVADALAAVGLEKSSPVPRAEHAAVAPTPKPTATRGSVAEKMLIDEMAGKKAPTASVDDSRVTRSVTRSKRGFNELELLLGVNPRWIADGRASRQRSKTKRLIDLYARPRTPSPNRKTEEAALMERSQRSQARRESPRRSPARAYFHVRRSKRLSLNKSTK
mmetsp:Transcript_9019/g.37191  ORF Transcript_9019/g.37191 Transcript_9019/m.37191 type:complete len:674 (+) Transcript_9019:72-2093(+)